MTKREMLIQQVKNIMADIKTVEQSIVDYVESKGIKYSFLANELGISSQHLHFILKGDEKTKRDLTQVNLDLINKVLGTYFGDFTLQEDHQSYSKQNYYGRKGDILKVVSFDHTGLLIVEKSDGEKFAVRSEKVK